MNIQIRRGLFETNSSSVHSITMCDESDFDRFKKGELVFDRYNERLVRGEEEEEYDGQFLTYEDLFDGYDFEYETYIDRFTTKKGDKVVAFGYFGHD